MKIRMRLAVGLLAAVAGLLVPVAGMSVAEAHDCFGITPAADPDNCAADWPPDADHMCTRQELTSGRVLYACTDRN